MVGAAPVAGERRIEHLAEPVDDRRLLQLAQDAAVDAPIFGGAFGGAGERAARHDDKLSAHRFDRLDLLFVGAHDVVDADIGGGIEMIGADAAADLDAGPRLRRFQCAADQFLGARPVKPAATLRGVHGFGDAEPQIPEIMPEGNSALPVDCRVEPGIDVGQRIGHHMRGGVGDAVKAFGCGR